MKKNLLGTWITQGDITFSDSISDFDFDWLCIDMEHTTISFEQMKNHIIAIKSKNKEAFVRVGKNDLLEIKKALDAGADGIIVPMINSYEDAMKAIENCFYPPKGKRGFGLTRANSYGDIFEDYTNQISKKIKLIVQIEHYQVIKDLNQILLNENIYGSFIGPYDLSGSLNKPGKFSDDDVQKYLKQYIEIASGHNKIIGYHLVTENPYEIKEIIGQGYNFIAINFDMFFLRHGIKIFLNKNNN